MKNFVYITVSTQGSKAAADTQSSLVIKHLDAGFEIISAVGDGVAVHYILAKDKGLPKPAQPTLAELYPIKRVTTV